MASTSTGVNGGSAGPRKNVTKVAPHPGPAKENRDPNHLNDHLTVDFHSIFAEPTTSPNSYDCTWEFSELCYDTCFQCFYGIFSTLCGCWIALYWGIQLVPFLFTNIWCLTPCNNIVQLVCGYWCKTFWLLMARCCIAPWTKACAPLFRYCGNGLKNPPKTPPIFQSGKQRPKPVPVQVEKMEEPEVEVIAVVPEKRHFDDYDKEKIARSVRRQMLL